MGACLAASSMPLLYRGITGRWPNVLNGHLQPDNTRAAFGGERGVHVRESVRLERPVADVYRFWRRLDNLPQFMTHLDRVSHELRQVVEASPETMSVCAGLCEPHRFPNVDSSLAPERRARILRLEMSS